MTTDENFVSSPGIGMVRNVSAQAMVYSFQESATVKNQEKGQETFYP